MAKGKGFDPVSDAHELAQHNINPYYWVNKVTSYTYARWMAEKRLAVIALPLYVLAWAGVILNLTNAAAERSISVWQLIFDFSSGESLAVMVQLLLMALYTLIVAIMVLQLALALRREMRQHDIPRPKETKQPKRRKDYH